jgi:hypothetical protein
MTNCRFRVGSDSLNHANRSPLCHSQDNCTPNFAPARYRLSLGWRILEDLGGISLVSCCPVGRFEEKGGERTFSLM